MIKNIGTNNKTVAALLQPRFCAFIKVVIAVRVSGGHLCEAEAPTEPAGETAVRRAAIRIPLLRRILILSRFITLAVPKSCFRLEREQLLTAALPFARFSLHRRRSQRHSE